MSPRVGAVAIPGFYTSTRGQVLLGGVLYVDEKGRGWSIGGLNDSSGPLYVHRQLPHQHVLTELDKSDAASVAAIQQQIAAHGMVIIPEGYAQVWDEARQGWFIRRWP